MCLPAILLIARYLFVNGMTTVSAVAFLYSPDTQPASVAILNLDDAGQMAGRRDGHARARDLVACVLFASSRTDCCAVRRLWRNPHRR